MDGDLIIGFNEETSGSLLMAFNNGLNNIEKDLKMLKKHYPL